MNETPDIIDLIDETSKKIRTTSLDISFNELYDMHQQGELVISPAYQRLFRWDAQQQSRFIETLILEMPVPPIFAIELPENRTYELIDGLQRISSYLNFRGSTFEDIPLETPSPLVLEGCEIVPSLNGLSYDDLPRTLQISLRRAYVRMEIIRKGSDSAIKYHMFKRLNTGGELLSSHEVRNATIRLKNGGEKAISFIDKCANTNDFLNTVQFVADEETKKGFKKELALRFFALKNDMDNYRNINLTDHLTNYLEKIADEPNFPYEAEQQLFTNVFKLLNRNLGPHSFSSATTSGFRDSFTAYLFDAITIATCTHLNVINQLDDLSPIAQAINQLKRSSALKNIPNNGTRANTLKRTTLFVNGIQDALDSIR